MFFGLLYLSLHSTHTQPSPFIFSNHPISTPRYFCCSLSAYTSPIWIRTVHAANNLSRNHHDPLFSFRFALGAEDGLASIAITRLPVLAVDAGPSAPHGMHQSVRASAQRPSTAPPPTVDLQRPMGRELLTRVCHAHLCNSEFVTPRTHRDRRASCITLMRT